MTPFMQTGLRGWVLFGAALLAALPAAAQSDPYTSDFFTRGPDAAYYLDSGSATDDPFYVPVTAWSLLPRLTITATRDDNVFLDSGSTTEGTTINLIPGLMAIYGRPEHNYLYADYGAILPISVSTDRLDKDPSHMFTLGGAYQTGKSQVYGRAGYRRLENMDTLVGARIVKEDQLYDLGLDYRVSAKTSVGVLGNMEVHRFNDPMYVDYRRLYGAGRLYHALTQRSEWFVQGGLGRDELDSSSGSEGSADFFDASLGLRGKPTAKTRVSGRTGYMWRTYEGNRIDDVNHWIASLFAESNPFGLTTFSAELQADIRPAINARGNTAIDQRLTVGATRRLFTERLRGNAAVFAGIADYRGPEGRPVEFSPEESLVYDRREDNYWGFTLGLDWWTRKNISVGLAYSYIENQALQDANEEDRDLASYDSGRWLLRISWNF